MLKKGLIKTLISVTPFVLGMLFGLVFFLCNTQPRWAKALLSGSEPIAPIEDRQYVTAVTDCYVHGERIYVLYGQKGLLKVYDTDGKCLHAYAYALKNFGALLYEYEDKIYLDSAKGWVLVFENGKYTDKIGHDQWDVITQKVPHRTSAIFASAKNVPGYYGDPCYTMHFGSIYRLGEDGRSTVVIPRPFESLLFQGMLPWIVWASCILFYFFMALAWNQRKKRT
ncbi:MAG: hypothetical protein IJR17_05105 [Clostridia bacterium]|nr:hypothetical protein [Clostridia bacterium]